MTPPPVLLGWPEIATFLLANAIIIWICAPRLWRDVLRWRREGRAGGGAGP